MSEQENIQLVKKLYEAFGRGDIQTILNALADDVHWHNNQPAKILPWAGIWKGRDQVAKFFAIVLDAVEYQMFEPTDFIAQGDKVVVVGRSVGTVKTTKRSVEQTWIMVWTVKSGKIVSYLYADDGYRWVAAVQAK